MTGKRYPSTILATAVIPWDERYRFDVASFRNQVRAFLQRGVNHLYLFGTAGEGYAITEEQYERIVAVFAEEMQGPDRYPMIGLISLSLPAMMQRIAKACALGIRDFQFSLPSWGALSDEELDLFLHTLCDNHPDCRFMHYNLGRAKRILAPDEYFRIAEEIPNFVGAKYTTDNPAILQKLVATPSPLQFFTGETGFAIGSMFGECGLLISLAGTRLERAWAFVDAARNKRYPELITCFNEMTGILAGLIEIAGAEKIDGAYDKLFVRMLDPAFPLRLLPPYASISDEQSDRYRQFLTERYPHWLE